jgi:hypothetical protein
MDKGRQDLTQHLFAATMARIEDAAGIAVAAKALAYRPRISASMRRSCNNPLKPSAP